MIAVSIKFMMYLQSAADLAMGKKEVTVELEEGTTFGGLLEGLERNFGPDLAKEIYDPQARSLKEAVLALINGTHSHNLNGTDTALHQGDSIVFVPLIYGG